MSRLPQHLHPEMQAKLQAFTTECDRHGLDFLVYCTFRSNQEQADEYAKGRTKPGKVVTWAKPGQSNHNFVLDGRPAALAFDAVPVRNGKLLVWGTNGNGLDDDPTDDDTDDLELWLRFGAIGESIGLEWAGRWDKPKREFPHFQLANARAIKSGAV